MSGMGRIVFQLVAYICVATVLFAGGGLIYLNSSGVLNDEKAFRVWAILHDIDLEQLGEEQQPKEDDLPPEELSFQDLERAREIRMRNHEAKMEQLRLQLQEFAFQRQSAQKILDRQDFVAKDFERRLAEANEAAIAKGNAEIARHWRNMKDAQIKEEIKLMKQDKMKEVVMLLKQMPENKLKKILSQFRPQEPDDVALIRKIHDMLAEGFPEKQVIDDARGETAALQTGQ